LSRQVAYGAAAAVAAAYQAPIAGVFFAVEIVLGEWAWKRHSSAAPGLEQLVGSSAAFLLGAGPLFAVSGSLPISHDPALGSPSGSCSGRSGSGLSENSSSVRSSETSALRATVEWSGSGCSRSDRSLRCGETAMPLSSESLQNKTMLLGIVSLLACRLVATTFLRRKPARWEESSLLHSSPVLPSGLAAGHLVHNPEPTILAICGMGLLMAAVTHAPLMGGPDGSRNFTGQWHLFDDHSAMQSARLVYYSPVPSRASPCIPLPARSQAQ